MLDNKSLIVLAYLKNYFKTNTKPITALEINIKELTFNDIEKAIETLVDRGYITLTEKAYLHPSIESVNY